LIVAYLILDRGYDIQYVKKDSLIPMFTVAKSLKVLQKKIEKFPSTLMILGTGWNAILDKSEVLREIPYDEIFGVTSSVSGHDGKFLIVRIGGKEIACMAGRFHTYEGFTSEEVTRPLQLVAQVGIKRVLITSAAGALNEKYQVGDFVILSDVITAFCSSPLIGPQFIDLSEAFDARLRSHARSVCNEKNISFHEGVYCYTKGPHFETPADKMMFHHAGADLIGMSTVPERSWLDHSVLQP
jgi:purine-nucleoside phosphorylase